MPILPILCVGKKLEGPNFQDQSQYLAASFLNVFYFLISIEHVTPAVLISVLALKQFTTLNLDGKC